MLSNHQSQVVTLTLAMRVYRSETYTIRCLAEHETLCALEKRGLVAYVGEALKSPGELPGVVHDRSTWTATPLLRNRMADVMAGQDVSAPQTGPTQVQAPGLPLPISIPSPALRFKVGDRVVVSKPRWGSALINRTYVIENVYVRDDPYYFVRYDSSVKFHPADAGGYVVYDDELSPAPPEVHHLHVTLVAPDWDVLSALADWRDKGAIGAFYGEDTIPPLAISLGKLIACEYVDRSADGELHWITEKGFDALRAYRDKIVAEAVADVPNLILMVGVDGQRHYVREDASALCGNKHFAPYTGSSKHLPICKQCARFKE